MPAPGEGLIDPQLLFQEQADAALDPRLATAVAALRAPEDGGFLPPDALASAGGVPRQAFPEDSPEMDAYRAQLAAQDPSTPAGARPIMPGERAAPGGVLVDDRGIVADRVPRSRASDGDEGGEQRQERGEGDFQFFDPAQGLQQSSRFRGPRTATLRNQVTQRTSTEGVDPERMMQEAQAGADARKMSAIEQADVATEGAQREAEAVRDAVRINNEAAAEVRDIQRQSKAAAEGMLSDMRQLSDEIQGGRIDPDRLWKERGTGARIGAVLAAALGGFGAALTGTRNSALDIINAAIDRDIQAQKENLANRRGSLEDMRGVYSVARTITSDAIEQEDAARVLALDGVEAKLKEFGATTQSEMVQARVGEMLAQIDQEKQALMANLAQSVADRTVTTTTEQTVPVGGGGGAAARPDGGIRGAEVIDPEAFQALDETQRRNVHSAVEAHRTLQRSFDTMMSLRREHGTEVMPGEVTGRYDTARMTAIGALTQLMKSGVLNEGEREYFEGQIPGLGPTASDVARIGGEDPSLGRLRGMRSELMNTVNTQMDTWGLRLAGTTSSRLDTEKGVE